MKVFNYFVEPASYTIDLVHNVYDPNKFDYCFIKSDSLAESDLELNKTYLDKLSFFKKIKFIYSIHKEKDFIIINGYNNYIFVLTFFLNVFSTRKKPIAIESDTKLRIPSNFIKRFFKRIYLSFFFRNKYVIGLAGGSKTHKDLFRFYGMNEDRIILIPMMVNNDKFLNEKIFPNTFTFLYVGRLISTKNVDVLCEKFIKNFSELNAKLIIVGGGKNYNNLTERFNHQKIDFKGKVFGNDLLEIYKDSSVFVFPSTWEQWGLVVNEALSASLPVIAHSEVGAVHDLIEGRGTGFVINNWVELEDKMLELYNNKSLLLKCSENAKKLMVNKWNYKLYEDNLLEIINRSCN